MGKDLYSRSSRAVSAVVATAAVMAVIACQGSGWQPTPAGLHAGIGSGVRAVSVLRSAEPGLPGFAYSDSVAANAISNRSSADADLLLARVYHDLAARVHDAPPATDPGALRRLLGVPRPVGRFTREYFDHLLQDTKSRTAVDPAFRSQVQEAARYAGSLSVSPCMSGDYVMPIIFCRFGSTWVTQWWWGLE